jgi:hypothetical protein
MQHEISDGSCCMSQIAKNQLIIPVSVEKIAEIYADIRQKCTLIHVDFTDDGSCCFEDYLHKKEEYSVMLCGTEIISIIQVSTLFNFINSREEQ